MLLSSSPLLSNRASFFCYPTFGLFSAQRNLIVASCSPHNLHNNGKQAKSVLHFEENVRRRFLIVFLVGSSISTAFPSSGKTKKQNPYDEKRLLEQNKRIQRENNVPDDFPNFVREGFTVNVVTSSKYVKHDSGLILWDIAAGTGDCPKDGQQVTFHYIGYNESGRRIDSTYLQGSPAKVRMGTNALIPGFEEGIRDMKPGGKRRIIVPPELGPPELDLKPFHLRVPFLYSVVRNFFRIDSHGQMNMKTWISVRLQSPAFHNVRKHNVTKRRIVADMR